MCSYWKLWRHSVANLAIKQKRRDHQPIFSQCEEYLSSVQILPLLFLNLIAADLSATDILCVVVLIVRLCLLSSSECVVRGLTTCFCKFYKMGWLVRQSWSNIALSIVVVSACGTCRLSVPNRSSHSSQLRACNAAPEWPHAFLKNHYTFRILVQLFLKMLFCRCHSFILG